MADIRCSHCGKDNPDFFDVCQFCQSPLKSESTLHAGEAPSEKDTGELEPILPEWLQDARQQSRDSVDDDSFSPDIKSKGQSAEPIDLLAGLASQDDSDEDDVPDWLSSINPVEEKGSSLTSKSGDKEEPSDFFSQFSQSESQPSTPATNEPEKDGLASFIGGTEQQADNSQADELGGWFSQASGESNEPTPFAQDEPVSDDNSWMNNLGSSEPSQPEPAQEKEPEDLSWLHDLETSAKQTDELSSPQVNAGFDLPPTQPESSGEDLSWLDNLGGTPVPSSEQPESSQDDLSWLGDLGSTPLSSPVETSSSQPEPSDDDLGWMKNLGDDDSLPTDETGSEQPDSSQDDLGWMKNLDADGQPKINEETTFAQAESSDDDLSWMKNLGADDLPDASSEQSVSSQDDLDWMKNLGNDDQSSVGEEITSTQAESSDDDLSWMKNLEEAQPSSPGEAVTESSQPDIAQDDLSWLNNLGGEPTSVTEDTSSQPASSQDDLDWMKNLGEEQSSLSSETTSNEYSPPGTAPLTENAGFDSTPDWLKSAMEEPSMPAPGDLSMDWFAGGKIAADSEADLPAQEPADLQMDEPTIPLETKSDFSVADSSSTSSQDVDDMFNIDMPAFDSQETGELPQLGTSDSLSPTDDELAPVELPSWVQAMRPVDSSIGDSSYVDEEQEVESEGPLAGFSGVIPAAPIGSSLRPKAFSMKLQVTDEQQAGASLIEQIIASESAAHPLKSTRMVASQRMLRWILSGLFLGVLSLVVGFGWQNFSIVAPAEVSKLSELVGSVPDGSPVLLVMDYDPAVAGELAAAAGPVLDQLALSKHSTFTFISMSPYGSAMVEHLMLNANISKASPEGLGYQVGEQYFSLGFLPGGSAGVLGFIEDSGKTMPAILSLPNATSFSDYQVVVLMTDNAESGRVWIEQLEFARQSHPEIASKPLVIVSSAQAGPMLEPYVSSGQAAVMINGLSDAAKYEYVNQSRPGGARKYWDSFGVGLMIAVLSIVLGSIWNVILGVRERRAEADLG